MQYIDTDIAYEIYKRSVRPMKIDKNLKISMSRQQLHDIIYAVDQLTMSEVGAGSKWYGLYVQLAAVSVEYDRINKERRQKRNARRAKRPFGGF